jgi:hypothetical protein
MRLVPFSKEQDLNRTPNEPTDIKIVQEVQENYRDKSSLSSFLSKEIELTKQIKGI